MRRSLLNLFAHSLLSSSFLNSLSSGHFFLDIHFLNLSFSFVKSLYPTSPFSYLSAHSGKIPAYHPSPFNLLHPHTSMLCSCHLLSRISTLHSTAIIQPLLLSCWDHGISLSSHSQNVLFCNSLHTAPVQFPQGLNVVIVILSLKYIRSSSL